MSRHRLLGCPIDSLTLDETVNDIIRRIRENRKPMQHCVVNTYKFLLMQRLPELKDIVHRCDMINADGQSVVWALQLLGRRVKERVAGIDLMEKLVERAAQENLSVYFFGSRLPIVEQVAKHYQKLYPTLRVAGYQHGYYRREGDEARFTAAIRDAKPDLLFVALDSPRKEYFLGKHLSHMNVPFSMGVGGSFDVIAGNIPRAPLWMQHNGLEWLWRLKQEPRRMFPRYLKSHTTFAWLLLKAYLTYRLNVLSKKLDVPLHNK
jgi:N-acetylglucosaminyldiphosphoundecaprenol N-acetyl-beta-D-mannosaminyltransferase